MKPTTFLVKTEKNDIFLTIYGKIAIMLFGR